MIFQNEILFICHLGVLLLATLGALRLGALALTVLISIEAILANLFVFKEISLFGFFATSTDVFAVASLYGLNLLREFYGAASSRIASNYSIGLLLLFALMSVIHLWYVPSEFDLAHSAYSTILTPAPRVFLASLLVYAIVQQVDLHIFGAMKKQWSLASRIMVSLIFSETLDTILFTFFGLYGVVSSIGSILCVSLVIKWTAIGLASPFSIFAKKAMKPA